MYKYLYLQALCVSSIKICTEKILRCFCDRFSATFFNKELGFFVDAYNGVSGNFSKDKSYWQILDGSLKPTRFGMSA